nr:hypothetical protein [Pseudophaeobacter leonis]
MIPRGAPRHIGDPLPLVVVIVFLAQVVDVKLLRQRPEDLGRGIGGQVVHHDKTVDTQAMMIANIVSQNIRFIADQQRHRELGICH